MRDIDAKGIYSPLISKLISENQHSNTNAYDGSKEAVVKIFKSLVNTYPNQPHLPDIWRDIILQY